MMRIALINDTHMGARGDSSIFNEFFFKFWENTFFPYLKENNIKHICHLGDVVDRRKFINFVTLNSWRKRFFDVLESEGITMDVIVGNHDVFYRNTNEVNAMHELFYGYKNINVYIDPVDLNFDGLSVAMMPWINSSNYESSLQFLKETKSEVVFGHFEIAGFEMDRGNVCHSGLNKKVFDRFDIVLSGHFHHKSSSGNITYLGNQYEMSWADHGDQRGFHVFDTDTREIDFVKNPFKIFHKISYDDTEQDFEYWKQYNYDNLKECYIKVIVVNKNNPYLFDNVIENLYKVGVADISIVEDFTEFEDENAEELIDQAEDTMTILSKYIDGLTLNVEPDKLKKIMRELYVESLTTEVIE
jgi:DNA repair exonuclease SbcCD nuclease subunit